METLSRYLLILICTIFLSACSSLPKTYIEQQQLTTEERLSFNQQVFDKAWSLVNDKFYDPNFKGNNWPQLGDKYRPEAIAANDSSELYRTINTMFGELKVSHFVAGGVSPVQKEVGSFGFVIRLIEGRYIVTEVLSGSPADKAGVKTGWLLNEFADISYLQESDDTYQGNVRPPSSRELGEELTFTFIDQAEQEHLLTISSALDMNPLVKLASDPVKARELPGGFLYFRVPIFNKRIVKSLKEELKLHASAPGVVVDLRRNPGGWSFYGDAAVGYFFEDTQDIGFNVKRDGKKRVTKSISVFSINYEGKVIILTDQFSASASESFSATLKYYNRATIVGRKTAGKVLTAHFYRLPDGGGIQIPIIDYLNLDEQRIEGIGVFPDIEVAAPSLETLRAGRDLDLEVALQALNGN